MPQFNFRRHAEDRQTACSRRQLASRNYMRRFDMKIPEKKTTTVQSQKAGPKRKRPVNEFDGVLTSISPTKLVMKGKDGKESSMKLHEKIKSTCDGETCGSQELKPGQKIRVVTQKRDLTIATKIASLNKKSRFAPMA